MRRMLSGQQKERETQFEEEGGDLDPEHGEEEMNHTVKTLGMFEARSDVESMQGSDHDEVDRVVKDDDGRDFVRCRLVARDFKLRRTTCSRRCHHWRRSKRCSHVLQGCSKRDENKVRTK